MRSVFAVLLFVLAGCTCFSQKAFEIHGKTNFVESGMAILRHDGPTGFYYGTTNDTVAVRNHFFILKGTISYPEQFRLSIIKKKNGKEYFSELFFIGPGVQNLLFDSLSKTINMFDPGLGISITGSEANDEYRQGYLSRFNAVNRRIDSFFDAREKCNKITGSDSRRMCLEESEIQRNVLREVRNDILLAYAREHPHSPILPWVLDDFLTKYGYKNQYAECFAIISSDIPVGMRESLIRNITVQKGKIAGKEFPLKEFVNNSLPLTPIQKNRYTLVDFWYSGCRPCLGQFALLRKVYAKYKSRNFEVIAVSTDEKKAIPGYWQLLKQQGYPWKQILDEGGTQAATMHIEKYPSNFLLDQNGRVVKTDISPEMLDIFLKNNL